MAPAILYQFQDLFFSVILHIASQLTHCIRSSPSDGNSSGRNTYDSHDLLHCIHRHSYPDVILVCLDIKVFHTLFLLRLREGQFYLDSVYLIHDGSFADQRIFPQYPGSTGIAGLYLFGQHLSFRTAAQSFMGIQLHPFIQKIMAGSVLTASEQRVGKANRSHCSQQLAFIMPLDGIFFSSGNILT